MNRSELLARAVDIINERGPKVPTIICEGENRYSFENDDAAFGITTATNNPDNLFIFFSSTWIDCQENEDFRKRIIKLFSLVDEQVSYRFNDNNDDLLMAYREFDFVNSSESVTGCANELYHELCYLINLTERLGEFIFPCQGLLESIQ